MLSALEPQFDPRDESLAWSNLAWNDWVAWDGKEYPFVPMVSRTKWLEPRHTVNITDRFTRDKTDSLQHAFFNGQGYATLENLWGFWYGDTAHDAEAILRCTRIERALADNLRSADWEPHTPTLQPGVFASRFPTNSSTLWTIVNRNEYDVDGAATQRASSRRNALLRFVARSGNRSRPSATIRQSWVFPSKDAALARFSQPQNCTGSTERTSGLHGRTFQASASQLLARVESRTADHRRNLRDQTRSQRSLRHDPHPGGRLRLSGPRH